MLVVSTSRNNYRLGRGERGMELQQVVLFRLTFTRLEIEKRSALGVKSYCYDQETEERR
jgi:hypothetical protein